MNAYGIYFDLVEGTVQTNEIKEAMEKFGFQPDCNFYIVKGEDPLAQVYKIINKLSTITSFRNYVERISVFKVEDWSDFTHIVKEHSLEENYKRMGNI
jgi:virulence-associated protein VapD